LRAYSKFATHKDWMEKLSSAFTVALVTRSADTYEMQAIQNASCWQQPLADFASLPST